MASALPPVTFPAADDPEVSCIVVAHGGLDLLRRTVADLASTVDAAAELIVVDNPTASGPADLGWLSGAQVIANPTNVGFGPAVDQATLVARAPVVVLVNPDVQLTPGWLDPLRRALAEGAVAASPRLVDPDGTTQELGSVVGPDGETLAFGRGPADALADDRVRRPVDYASAACLAVARAELLAVGGFDASWGAGYFEDVDLAQRWGEDGRRIEIVPEVAVVHHRHATTSASVAAAMMDERRAAFVARWGRRLRGRPSLTDVVSRPHRLRSAVELARPDRLLVLAGRDDRLVRVALGLAHHRRDLAVTLVCLGASRVDDDLVEVVDDRHLDEAWFATRRLVALYAVTSVDAAARWGELLDGVVRPVVTLVVDDDRLVDAAEADDRSADLAEAEDGRWAIPVAGRVGAGGATAGGRAAGGATAGGGAAGGATAGGGAAGPAHRRWAAPLVEGEPGAEWCERLADRFGLVPGGPTGSAGR